MLHHGRIKITEGVDLTESIRSKKCLICHYCLFNHGFKFEASYAMIVMI